MFHTDDWAGFFFVGAATVPALLAWAGAPGIAAIVFVALLCAGALAGHADRDAPFRTLPGPGAGDHPRAPR